MKKAILYLRVSTKEQEKEGFSLDAQEKQGYDYAKKQNIEIVRVWKVSESAWGQKSDRKHFIQMVEYAQQHPEIEHIIFDITDRMTRNDSDKVKINILIKDFGKTIHFSRTGRTYNRNSDSDEFFMMDMEVAFAKKMSADISKKTKMGQREKAEQGIFPTAAPIGYLNDQVKKTIYVDKERAPFIQKAFALMATGNYSIQMLDTILYRQGFRSKKGNHYAKSSLHRQLSSPFYYGVFVIGDRTYQGTHEPLISKELFDQVQNVLRGKDRVQPTIQKRNFPFTNLVACGNCGCKVLGEMKKGKYVYYHCSYSKGRHKACVPYLTESRISDLFVDSVRNLAIPGEIVDLLKRNLKEFSVETDSIHIQYKKTLEQELATETNRLGKLLNMRLNNELDEESFKTKRNEIENLIADLKSQLQHAERTNPNFYEDGVKTLELCETLHSQYVRVNSYEKVELLKNVASNYTIHDVTVTPAYRKPFNYIAEGLRFKNWGRWLKKVRTCLLAV